MNLKELADNLGLSQTTVSRALNGYPEVSEATRLRVAEAAARLGYRANASARRLATGRAGAFGMVLRTEAYGPHTVEFLGGLAERLFHDEMDILVSTVETAEEEAATYRRAAASKKVDAVILASPYPDDARVHLLNDLGLPYLLHGRSEGAPPHAWLDIDNAGATERATNHLLDLGHRRIALVNGPRGMTFANHREDGYRAALTSRQVAPVRSLIANTIFTDEMGFRTAQQMLERGEPPTAFVAGSMMTALGIFRAIRAAGLELGKDISMIAHDDVFPYLNADNMVPSMSTTRSSIRAAGTRVGELLMQLLAGKSPADIHEVWPVDLVLRESTGPAPVK